MRKVLLLAVGLSVLACCESFGQGEIPVNMYTGTPSVEIPITTISDRGISLPIRLSYNAGGLRLGETAGIVGAGWNLSDYSITRQVRGLPDEYKGTGSDTRRGWLHSTNVVATIGNAPYTNCNDEQADFTAINSLNWSQDTEPDLFRYSIGSISGSFVFDKNGEVNLIPMSEVIIEPTFTDETSKDIYSFKITTNDGSVFNFRSFTSTTRWTESITTGNVEFFRHDYELYNETRHGARLGYKGEWKLSSINSNGGGSVSINYADLTPGESLDTTRVSIRDLWSSAFITKPIFITHVSTVRSVPSVIHSTVGMQASFEYKKDLLQAIEFSDTRNLKALPRRFEMSYTEARPLHGDGQNQFYFLSEVKERVGCIELPPFKMTYSGVPTTTVGKIDLPLSFSKSVDFWGYYNGANNSSLAPKLYVYPDLPASERYRLYPIPTYSGVVVTMNGANRTPNALTAEVGSLKSITYPAGGVATINYESNQYYDEASGQDLPGGGLRVSSIGYYDGLTPATEIKKFFTYTNAEGKSSGRLVDRPMFAIPTSKYIDPVYGSEQSYDALTLTQNTEGLWQHLTARSEANFSPGETTQGSVVGYTSVKVQRPGSGYVIHEFSTPAVFGQNAAGDWQATVNRYARSGSCPAPGLAAPGTWSYPYAPNPIADYERGLITHKSEYNEAGTMVRQMINEYQYLYRSGAQPKKVSGLYYEGFSNAAGDGFFYGKYFLNTGVSKVLSSAIVTTYDAANANHFLQERTDYYYESSVHRLLNRVQFKAADGTEYTTRTRYPQDYGSIPAAADKTSEMIGWMQGQHMEGTVIESVSYMKKPGQPEKVVSGGLLLFDNFAATKPLPAKSLVLRLSSPKNDFSNSSVNAAGIFQYDNAYEEVRSNIAYDSYGNLIAAKGIEPVMTSTHLGYEGTLPVAQARYASYDEFAFSDFETTTGNDFTANHSIYGTGRTGLNALYADVLLTTTVRKANVDNYTLSFWFKKNTTAVDFKIRLKDTNGTLISEQIISVSSEAQAFTRIVKSISVSAAPPLFVIEMEAMLDSPLPQPNPGIVPLIDDVAFYPDEAELTTYTYSIPYGISSVTDPRGQTVYTDYDPIGRISRVLDKDKNIVQRNTYHYASTPVPLYATISIQGALTTYSLLDFVVSTSDCIQGATYEWDFGNGYIQMGNKSAMEKTYTAAGYYHVKVRVTHPDYGQTETEREFTITSKPIVVNMCAKGLYTYNRSTGNMTYYTLCTAITKTPKALETIFRAQPKQDVANGDDGFASYTYRWLRRRIDQQTWVEAGTDSEYSRVLSSPYESYVVKCEVLRNNGQKGETEEYAVFVTNGNESN